MVQLPHNVVVYTLIILYIDIKSRLWCDGRAALIR